MARLLLAALLVSFAAAAAAEDIPAGKPAEVDVKAANERASYAIGFNVGRDLFQGGFDPDKEAFLAGLEAALAGAKNKYSTADLRKAFEDLEPVLAERRAEREKVELARRKTESAANLKAGGAFLDANKAKPGVKTLESGLQYKVVKSGKGDSPKLDDTVRTHYRGTLIDGTEFDSSYARGEPAEFPVGGVIKGWIEALQLMKPGDKWQLFIPSDLAYGEEGRPGIPSNSVLVFDIELLEIVE